MTRLMAFHSYKEHAMLKKDYNKLSKDDIAICEMFINNRNHLDWNEFAHQVNRWYLDDQNKPKNWTIMWGLVYQAGQKADWESKK